MDDEPIGEEGVHWRHGKASAEFTAQLEELEEEFQCGVCFNLIVLPTTLSCGHSFCRHCLAQWFDFGKKMECPSCRQVRLVRIISNIVNSLSVIDDCHRIHFLI